jgi:hypothetical protein
VLSPHSRIVLESLLVRITTRAKTTLRIFVAFFSPCRKILGQNLDETTTGTFKNLSSYLLVMQQLVLHSLDSGTINNPNK